MKRISGNRNTMFRDPYGMTFEKRETEGEIIVLS